jgi:hypothetical protein
MTRLVPNGKPLLQEMSLLNGLWIPPKESMYELWSLCFMLKKYCPLLEATTP